VSNVIGFNGRFDTLNLGAAETQGLEAELVAQPIADLVFIGELHLTRRGKDIFGGHFAATRRAVTPPLTQRNLRFGLVFWCKRLRSTAEAKFVNARAKN
jgi:hypothetical protein